MRIWAGILRGAPSLMQQRAPRVFRWVERMNRPDPDVGEFPAENLEFIGDDLILETLVAVLKHVAEDFVELNHPGYSGDSLV